MTAMSIRFHGKHLPCSSAANDGSPPFLKGGASGPFRTLTGHRMPRCSFPDADINWSSNFSIHKRLSMRSCTTRTLHVNQAIAIPGYAAQVSVRAGSVIAHLASLNRNGPERTSSSSRNAAMPPVDPDIHCIYGTGKKEKSARSGFLPSCTTQQHDRRLRKSYIDKPK